MPTPALPPGFTEIPPLPPGFREAPPLPVGFREESAQGGYLDTSGIPAQNVSKPVNAVRTLNKDGTYTYAQPTWLDYATTVPTQIIGGIRRGLGGMASGAAQMDGDVSFETAQQLRREIAAPGMAMQESVRPTREAYESANPVRAAAIGIVPEFLSSFTGPVRTLGETSEMAATDQAYQTALSVPLTFAPVPLINLASKMSKPAAAAFSTVMAGLFGEAGAAAQSYGPGGGGDEQFAASQAPIGISLPLAGLGGYATGGGAASTMRAGFRRMDALRNERKTPYGEPVGPDPYVMQATPEDIAAITTKPDVPEVFPRMTQTDRAAALADLPYKEKGAWQDRYVIKPPVEIKTPGGETMVVPEPVKWNAAVEAGDVRTPAGETMQRPVATTGRGEALARSLTKQATTPTAETMRQPVGFDQNPADLVQTPAGSMMDYPIAPGARGQALVRSLIEQATQPTSDGMRQPVGFRDPIQQATTPTGDTMSAPVGFNEPFTVETPSGAGMNRPVRTSANPADIVNTPSGDAMSKPVASNETVVPTTPTGESMRQPVGFNEPVVQATQPSGTAMKGPQRLTPATKLETKTPKSASMAEPVETVKRDIYEGDKVQIKGQGDTPVDVLNVDAETGAIQVRGREEFLYPEDVQVVRRGSSKPELKPSAAEVPRVQEAPARSAEPTPESRPASDTGPAPTVEAAPVETQAVPFPYKTGDKINRLSPDGKPAVRDLIITKVDDKAGTVTVQGRASGKPETYRLEQIEPVKKPVGELPTTVLDEKPTSFGPQRNRSRSGSVPLGGGRQIGGGTDVVDMAGKAVRAVGGTVAKTARLVTRHSEEALLNVGRGDLVDRSKKVDTAAENMMTAPSFVDANRRAQPSLRETETVRSSLKSKAPASGTGQAYPEMQMVIEGKGTSSSPIINRLSKAVQDINRITADWAKGVEGFGPGTEGGKVLLRQWTNQARRMVSLDRNNPMRKAWVDALAKDNNLSPDAVETILRDQQGLIEGPEGVIRRDPLEAHRLLKNVGADFWYNNKRIPILDINTNTYGGSVSQSAAKRIAFAQEFGTKFDPAAEVTKGHPLLSASPDSKEISAVRGYVRAAHGIDVDRPFTGWLRESVDANLPRTAMVRDVISEGASFALPVYKNALLTARAISNLTGIPAMAGNVGWSSVGKALLDTIKTRGSGKALVEAGYISDMLHTLGGQGRMEAAKNVANEVLGNIAGGKAADRLTVVIAAHAGLDKVSQMKSGKNATHNSTMLQVLGYSSEMATKLAKGLGSANEYKQVVRDVVHTVTGQTNLKTTQGASARSKIIRDHIPFISFMNEQMRTLVRQLDLATDAGTSKEIRSAAFQQMANKLLGLAISGAGAALAVELLTTGETTASERPVAFAGEAIWRAFGGTWAQQLINAVSSDKPAWEAIASMSLPIGAVKDASKAVYQAAMSNSSDPLFNLVASKTTAAKHARDYLSWAHGLDTGVQPAATRRAIASFYDFAKSNPNLLSSPIQEGFKTEITPLGAAIRKIPKGRYGQPEAIATALREAAIIGKDENDVYRALMAKRMLPKFKKDYRDYAYAKLRNDIGPTAFREIMLYDMLLETLASSVK
jgi:hypothetical protein